MASPQMASPTRGAGPTPLRRVLRALAPLLLAAAAAPAAARIDAFLGDCVGTVVTSGGNFSGFSMFSEQLSTPSCQASTSAMSGVGYGSALASASWFTGSWDSGSLVATTSVAFKQEGLTVVFGSTPPDDLGGVFFTPSISVTGEVSAPAGENISTSAGIYYTISALGTQLSDGVAENNGVASGTAQLGLIRLPEVFAIVGQTFSLSASAAVTAAVGKLFQPGQVSRGGAVADFSHTLRWMGVSDVRFVDLAGQPMAPSPDLVLQLVGDSSGFDYTQAAPVPEPPAALLLALGGGVTGLAARRRVFTTRLVADARAPGGRSSARDPGA